KPKSMDALLLLGRIFFVVVFFLTVPGNFKGEKIQNASKNGVPLASLFVPLGSAIALAGSLSILLGFHSRIGAWLIVLFMIPTTFTQHRFWAFDDPVKRRAQYVNFLKNISIVGGALMIAAVGSGTWSVDSL